MSRGNNRNKIKKSSKGSKGVLSSNLVIILMALLVAVAGILIVSIRSNSRLQGALTMINEQESNFIKTAPVPNPYTTQPSPSSGIPMQIVTESGGSIFIPLSQEQKIRVHANKNGDVIRINANLIPTSDPSAEHQRQPSHHQYTGDFHKVELDSSSKSNNSHTTFSNSNFKSPGKHYNYYYYDSFSQSFHLHDYYTTYPVRPVPSVPRTFQTSPALSGKYQPALCKDGHTYGFSDLSTLRNAIHELGDAFNNAVRRWTHLQLANIEYRAILRRINDNSTGISQPPPLPQYMTDLLNTVPDPFVICPHTRLTTPIHGRHAPIYINAEDVVIECDRCIIQSQGTHFSFGEHAKNAIVRGVTMEDATDTSVVLREDGADVLFENCFWRNNEGVGIHGAVLDLNSTSVVNLHHCKISDTQDYSPHRINNGNAPQVHSLTMRSKDYH